MRINIEISSFGELLGEISGVKGVPKLQTGGPPSEPIWRPLVTWRRVLRTIIHVEISSFGSLGALPLVEGGGAKHSPPSHDHATSGKNDEKLHF